MKFKMINDYCGMVGLTLIDSDIFNDHRGSLWTTFLKNEFNIPLSFIQDKFSISKKNVLRGLHGDFKTTKLVTCIYGEIFQVAVDMRPYSSTYKKHTSIYLNDRENRSLIIPPGFANGFLVTSDEAVYHYKLSYEGLYFDADRQFTCNWNSEELAIKWPIENPVLSERDM